MKAHTTRNTDKDYPCVNCGSKSTNIIREADDPRLKCNNCNFLFNGSQSAAAKEADAIPKEPPTLKPEPVTTTNPREPATTRKETKKEEVESPTVGELRIPRQPAYVLIRKNRKLYQFCREKDLKKTILKWEAQGGAYDVFELTLKKAEARIDIA